MRKPSVIFPGRWNWGREGGASGPSGAYASLQKQDLGPALSDYTEVIRLNPDAASYNNRGVAHDGQGEFDKAILDFNEAIRLNARSRTGVHQPGRIVPQEGRLLQGHRRLQRSPPPRPQ